MVCMAGKVVSSQGPIHYLPGNHSEKRTRLPSSATAPLSCAYGRRPMRRSGSITSEVIASRVPIGLAHSPRESAADLDRSLLSPYKMNGRKRYFTLVWYYGS